VTSISLYKLFLLTYLLMQVRLRGTACLSTFVERRLRQPSSDNENVFITARCTVQSALLRSHVVRPYVVCDVGGVHRYMYIGWKSRKLIARTISLTSSLFVAQRPWPSTYLQRNVGEFWGRLEVGWGKVACCMEHKSGNISETRKYRGKVTMEGL